MKRLAAIATAGVFALMLGPGSAGAGEGAAAPDSPVEVTNYGKKAAVTFDHTLHQGVECAQCHHPVGEKGDSSEQAYRCGTCHKSDEEGGVPKIKDAFHKKEAGACYTCHLAKDAEHKMKCSDCHRD